MAKQGYEDWLRHRVDYTVNNELGKFYSLIVFTCNLGVLDLILVSQLLNILTYFLEEITKEEKKKGRNEEKKKRRIPTTKQQTPK